MLKSPPDGFAYVPVAGECPVVAGAGPGVWHAVAFVILGDRAGCGLDHLGVVLGQRGQHERNVSRAQPDLYPAADRGLDALVDHRGDGEAPGPLAAGGLDPPGRHRVNGRVSHDAISFVVPSGPSSPWPSSSACWGIRMLVSSCAIS